jgi:uroporphyrinogen-III decarboxylase
MEGIEMNISSDISQIQRLFSKERLERSRKRLEAIWRLSQPEDRIPFVFKNPPHEPKIREDFFMEAGYDEETSLKYQIDVIKSRSFIDDDYIPSLFPGLRQGAIPTAFGCEEVLEGDHFWCKPLMIKETKDIYKLKKPQFNKVGGTRLFLERIKYFRKKTKGQLPIHICDMQGPLDVASAIWGYQQFLTALYDYPDEVHFLLNLATESIIEFIRLQMEAAAGDIIPMHCWAVVWMPIGKGISISEDLAPILSPELYKEFGIPYHEKIAQEFGGVFIHSCGNFSHNLDNLKNTKGLIGMNFSISETPLESVVTQMGNKYVFVPHIITGVSCRGLPAYSQEEHVKKCMRIFRQNNSFAQVVIGIEPDWDRKRIISLNQLALEESTI